MKLPFLKRSTTQPSHLRQVGTPLDARAIYRVMLTARMLDEMEAKLVARGEAFFHVSGAGHDAG